MTSVMWKKCLAHTALCLFTFFVIFKVVESNTQLHLSVQLQEYYNEYNLQYTPGKSTTPYCCCSKENTCFNSTDASNLTYESCPVKCSLRFMICADFGNVTTGAGKDVSDCPYCYTSVVKNVNLVLTFGCGSSSDEFFPDETIHPQFLFSLEEYSQNDFNNVTLIVVIENQRRNFNSFGTMAKVYFETVDKVYIPIAVNSFSQSNSYYGMYGIAKITLGYMSLIITSKGNSDSVQQDTITLPAQACFGSALVEEDTMIPTAMFASTSQAIQPTMSPMDMSVKTVTITQTVEQTVGTSPSMQCESTQSASSSSSVWMPVSLFLLVVSMALLIVVAIVTVAAFYLLRKKKRISDEVPTEEGTNSSGTQEAVHNVDNVLYALPSTTSKEMPQVNGSNKEGNEVPLLGITNDVYALPTQSPDQRNPVDHPMTVTPTEAKGEEGKYMELSDAIIAPSDYLCPAKTAT